MAKRGRISARQRAAREAGRRAAAAVRLAEARPPGQRLQPQDAVAGVPRPARAADGVTMSAGDVAVSVCAPGCQVCAEAREEFAAIRAASLMQRRRFHEPDRYPYAAGKHTLHRSACRQIEQRVGGVEGDGSPQLHGALTRFAHDGALSSGWATHMRVMEPAEAATWVKERTGPRGGTRYRLCGICAPVPPESG
ncbi:hypothetical protein AB0N50_28730 [Streptomyces pharetrae]|jgi:hypothetical protein|uniref:hypothetical protein n=1 Tax=Streptomyces pharetrae TaxID=291370 RepID=UPI003460F6FA